TLQTVDVAAVTPVARRVAAGPLHQGAKPLFGGRVVEVVQPVEIQRTLHGADIVLHLGDTGLVRPVHHPRHHHRGKDAENDHHHHDLDQGETTLGKGSCLYALHNQLTSWLSSKMGNRMASTMMSTTPPIARISRGSKTPMTMAIRASSSRSWVSAARSSILSSVPLLSPLLIRLSVIGGKQPLRSSAWPTPDPSRTRFAASVTASRMGVLLITEALMFSASSSGTPLPARIFRVRAKRAVFRPRTSRPINGSFSMAL